MASGVLGADEVGERVIHCRVCEMGDKQKRHLTVFILCNAHCVIGRLQRCI